MLSPRQIFEDNIRPADLLLKVFRLLEHDALNTEEALLRSLRELVKAEKDESLLVISNEHLPGTDPRIGRGSAVSNQAQRPVQPACGRPWLPPALRWKRTCQSSCGTTCPKSFGCEGGILFPRTTKRSRTSSKNLTFDLDEAVRILVDPDPLFVANKMISSLDFSYLNGKRGIHVTGVLLALDNPWELIAQQLGRDEEEIKKTLDATVKRRNDIVHRADRSQEDPGWRLPKRSAIRGRSRPSKRFGSFALHWTTL